MWINNLNPILFRLGPLQIRYYGLVYFLCALFAYWWLNRASKKGEIKLTDNEISDLVLWLLMGVIIGARIFAIVFYDLNFYLSQPWWKLFAVWEGGLSFHGGLAGIIVAAYIFCKRKKIELLKLADILSFPLMLFLTIGRIANFINGELWGKVSNAPWCVVFPREDNLCRHPYQLYEAIKRFVITGWLVWIGRKTYTTGFIFFNFIFWEGLGRFLLDFYNVEELILGLTPGQWLSLVMVAVSGYLFVTKYRQDWKKLVSKH